MARHPDRHGEGRGAEVPRGAHRPLVTHAEPAAPRAAVVLLHGGREAGLAPPPWLNLPALRMRPFGAAIRRAPRGGELLLASVRYRCRGWNGQRADAARDARRALEELAARVPGLPVVLVGHSMGGRAALAAGDHPSVRGVVALAPWCPPDEPAAHLEGRTLVVLHDEHDRITVAAQSWEFARRAERAGARAHRVVMPRGGHAMLRDVRHWHRLTAVAVAAVLDGGPPPSPLGTRRRAAGGTDVRRYGRHGPS